MTSGELVNALVNAESACPKMRKIPPKNPRLSASDGCLKIQSMEFGYLDPKMILDLLARAASWLFPRDELHVQPTSASIADEPEDVTLPWLEAANQAQALMDSWHAHERQKAPAKEAV